MPCWIDGCPAELLPLADRGLAYGDGLFETIRVRGGKPQLLERHLQRLSEGCRRLLLPVEPSLVREELTAFAAQAGDAVIKLIITRGDGQRGYVLPQPQRPRRMLLSAPIPDYPQAYAQQGVSLFPCATRLAEQPVLAGIKHLNRLEQVLARAEWQDALYAEGLLRDQSGRVIEAVSSNLFLVCNEVLLTPKLSNCGVAGVMRAEILDQAARLGIVLNVCDIAYAELLAADEVFICNSLYGIWPVRELAGHGWSVGPLTRTLQATLHDLLGN